ncbi:beta-galactosidase [Arcticibacter pallidicorallinus]|uniref:Beta-galactosidase n=1 Tax=Arcticibacter pallidicorallinus TaxID=1259464 RepID=A0A2T0UB69_9SPHI|nr:glycoside hydrolase family 2 TIM barrel-domain containing protein [Arcticibacter pallidicorallinus]PRY55142.1 beta-galactosidase [Arcticibacter pallidicorallinus]
MVNWKKITLLLLLAISQAAIYAQVRKITSFDDSWRFFKGDAPGAEKPAFNDLEWRLLDVPHDWSIEGPYDKSNPTARGGGYLPAGIGWYRKTFTLDETDARKKHWIEFDGVMMNSEVWINGAYLGKRPYGYISFSYDLTKHLKVGKGQKNVLVVKADNTTQPASRYYQGAGIYRHVRLVSVNPVHFMKWGTFITTPEATAASGKVAVQAKVVNASDKSAEYTVETIIQDDRGKPAKSSISNKSIAAGDTLEFSQNLEVAKPKLWDIEQPNLYKVVVKLKSGATVIDDQTITFGIKTSKFDAATGFWLNDKNYKIKGVCLHHDAGAVGSAVPLAVWEERFKLLKEVGVNGIRTSHNPVAPEFLDLCDRMGFVVMDETFDTWTASKHNGEKGYNLYFKEWWERDTRDMILRDRNHPSIVIYSIGNEIHDPLTYPEGYKRYKEQEDVVKKFDPTRPVTMALFRPNVSKVYSNGFAEQMEVVGQNYRENELVAAHEANPHWKVIGTENTHVLSQWLALRDKPYMAGQFLWTGFDYLGEADWPETTNNQGLFDRANNWKQQALQRQSWWSAKPVVRIVRKSDNAGAGNWVANWTPTDFDTYDNAKIQVYSNCDEVELFLNGKSQGTKSKPADDSAREWDITFEPGTLRAVGKNKGVEVTSEEFKSAGAPAKLILSASKNKLKTSWDDASIIQATIVDSKGIPCTNADNLIKFSVTGSGKIQGVDNGNIISHEPYASSQYPAFMGKAIAIIKAQKGSSEKITVKAQADGLEMASVIIDISK